MEDFELVDSYAWGAALLAFLYCGIFKWKTDKKADKEEKKTIDGNSWLILVSFYFCFVCKTKSSADCT